MGRRIAQLRERAHMTQAAVAEVLEMTLTNYQRIEHGMQNLTIKTMARIADALDVEIIELFREPAGPRRTRGRPRAAR